MPAPTIPAIDAAIERLFPRTSCLAPDLRLGDRIVETGLAGVIGTVAALRVGPDLVDVTLDDGARHALAKFEVCRVERGA